MQPSATYERLRDDVTRRMRMRPIERVKRMVGKILPGNGITAYGNGAYSLIGGNELNDVERDKLLQLCRQRLDGFREQQCEELAPSSPGSRAAGAS